jgi:hypothetical protein
MGVLGKKMSGGFKWQNLVEILIHGGSLDY